MGGGYRNSIWVIMARIRFEKGSEAWVLFMDFYNLTQELWGIENTESYWDGVRDAVDAFAAKHGAFGVGMGVALLNELKRRSELEKQCCPDRFI